MSHTNTARMLAYWEERRGQADAPRRSSIDPAQFADVVTQVFMVGRERAGVFPFRLAGALLEDLHRGPLTGLGFTQLWSPEDRPRLQAAMESALQRHGPLMLHAQGRTSAGHQARVEILLSPLVNSQGAIDRLLGIYQPVSPLFRLQDQKIDRLFLLEAVMADGSEPDHPSVRLASLDGRRVA